MRFRSTCTECKAAEVPAPPAAYPQLYTLSSAEMVPASPVKLWNIVYAAIYEHDHARGVHWALH